MKWTVYKFMGRHNPVCEDAGELEILIAPFGSPYFRADGIVFAPSDNWQVLRRGLTGFFPFEDVSGNFIAPSFPDSKYPDIVDKYGNKIFLGYKYPITTDPRVLMVMHDYFHRSKDAMTKVPTRLEAVNYLLRENALYPLMSMSIPYEKNEPTTLEDLAAQGLTPEMI